MSLADPVCQDPKHDLACKGQNGVWVALQHGFPLKESPGAQQTLATTQHT